MVSIIGAVSFSVVILVSILILFGFPLGELTMGGKYQVFPKPLRVFVLVQLIVQLCFVVVILQMGGFIPLWFSKDITKIIGIVMSVYLTLNVILNLISGSKKEKYVMTPISIIAASCFWITAINF